MKINPALLEQVKQFEVIEAVRLITQQTCMPVFLVGGAVRDLLIGTLPENDFDFVTGDNPVPLARRFARKVSGSFIVLSEEPPNYRIVFYRNHKRVEVDFSALRGSNIDDDLRLRDFTVNALALSVNDLYGAKDPPLFDPTRGQADLQSKTLRVTSGRSFNDDPLRILRAVRIAKAMDLSIENTTREEILRKRDLLRTVAIERIRSEFFKAVSYPGAPETIKMLDAFGFLAFLFFDSSPSKENELKSLRRLFPANTVLRATGQIEGELADLGSFCRAYHTDLKAYFAEEIEAEIHRSSLLKLGGVLQDLVHTSREGHNQAIHYRETQIGDVASAAHQITKRLRFGKKASGILRTMVERNDRVKALLQMPEVPERACFRYFYDLGPAGIETLLLCRSELLSYGKAGTAPDFELRLRNLAHRLIYYYYAEFCISQPQPLLSGNELISLLGLKEGALIGTVLAEIGQAEAKGLLSTRDEALEFAKKLINRDE